MPRDNQTARISEESTGDIPKEGLNGCELSSVGHSGIKRTCHSEKRSGRCEVAGKVKRMCCIRYFGATLSLD